MFIAAILAAIWADLASAFAMSWRNLRKAEAAYIGDPFVVFDLGVDARSGELGQLKEAVEMLRGVYAGLDKGKGVTIVISMFFGPGICDGFVVGGFFADVTTDHLCKPNLRLGGVDVSKHHEFVEWRELVMAAYPKTYMKLSGAFSELLPLEGEDCDISGIVDCLQPWTDVVFDAFGAGRVMFGSDWSVCSVGGGGNEVSWGRWRRVVEEVLIRRGLSEEEKKGIWGDVALKAYGIP
ncbi:uncharacterized protein N7515_009775 [Penicillium bovifimosum]|uniref:Amidohydrolase-related domain-containing protein n=1 Tax=Penicillium bovifimosum TaxID=126998 RepID=A0A9W9GIK7_9EURO|nr:uncharacterized protein N7515_009775 [Penicillium bovifimosum]KAJ5120387.1 hypothetical protein N7515_009775 [Penicillium bovifimosum]